MEGEEAPESSRMNPIPRTHRRCCHHAQKPESRTRRQLGGKRRVSKLGGALGPTRGPGEGKRVQARRQPAIPGTQDGGCRPRLRGGS